jgi:23S rRNA pseudouridine1911/1915/1917 synthase
MTEPATIHEALIPAELAGWRLDRALAKLVPILSRDRMKALISAGQVHQSGERSRDPKMKAVAGAHYFVTVPAPRTLDTIAQDIPLTILFEDEHLLIVDKPAGLVVHPAAGNFDGTLVNALLHHCAGRLSGIGGVARPGIVHRIDKDTSGLLVVAKTDPAHTGLAAQFSNHSVNRRYQALISGTPRTAGGTIDAWLARSPANRKKIAIMPKGRGKSAITHWSMVERLKEAALIECRLETGRTHQIRVHLSSIGHTLIGDPVYGSARTGHREILKRLKFERQALHAATLGFLHPVSGDTLNFHSSIPSDMQALLSELRLTHNE